jgi:hypothetical protein
MSLDLPSLGCFFTRRKENDNEGSRDEKIEIEI